MLTDVADTLQSDRCLAGLACWPLIAEQCEPASGLIKLGEKMEGKKDPGRAIKPIICSVMSTGVSCNCSLKFTEAQRLSVLWQLTENIYYLYLE